MEKPFRERTKREAPADMLTAWERLDEHYVEVAWDVHQADSKNVQTHIPDSLLAQKATPHPSPGVGIALGIDVNDHPTFPRRRGPIIHPYQTPGDSGRKHKDSSGIDQISSWREAQGFGHSFPADSPDAV